MTIPFKITKLERSLLRILCKKPHKTAHALTKFWLRYNFLRNSLIFQDSPFALVSVLLAVAITVFAVFLTFLIAGVGMTISGAIAAVLSLVVLLIHVPTGLFALGSGLVVGGIGLITSHFVFRWSKGLIQMISKTVARLAKRGINNEE